MVNEVFTNGLNYDLLYIISIASILCGISVIIIKNPIVSVLFLIGLFFTIAAYLMMLGINFIGLSYLLVYVGAVSILFLFILMMINVRVSELVTDNTNSIPLAVMIGIFFHIGLNNLLPYQIDTNMNTDIYTNAHVSVLNKNQTHYIFSTAISQPGTNLFSNSGFDIGKHNADLSFVTSHIWDGALAETSHITTIGNIIYTSYPLWLILTSIILLLAMVGAIIITIKN